MFAHQFWKLYKTPVVLRAPRVLLASPKNLTAVGAARGTGELDKPGLRDIGGSGHSTTLSAWRFRGRPLGSVLSVARAQHLPDGRHEFFHALIQGAAPCGTLDPLCLQRNRQLVDALVGFLESLPNLLKALFCASASSRIRSSNRSTRALSFSGMITIIT